MRDSRATYSTRGGAGSCGRGYTLGVLRAGVMMTAACCVVAAAGGAPPTVVLVPAGDAEPGGPMYDFRIGVHEVRNDAFVAFLNDALAHQDNARGDHMFFDVTTGRVHVGASAAGPVMFDPDANGHIALADGVYTCDSGFADHPVSGVSWFGAVKYCNWLTIDTGLALVERAYAEGDSAAAWHPVTISDADWAVRDVNAAERLELVLDYTGYRLPMDGGADQADAYGEWYKAAAWDGAAGVHHTYGFGRDSITAADANFDNSDDPFEPGTTPVGFFDGTLYNPGGGGSVGDGGEFPTAADDNAYGVFDMSGNVREWLQDQSTTDQNKRRVRGGSWINGTFSLQAGLAASGGAGDATGTTGFRMVQSVSDGFLITPFQVTVAGPWGGPYDAPGPLVVYVVENVSPADETFQVATDVAWLNLNVFELTVAAGDAAAVLAQIAPDCGMDGLSIGSNVATVTFSLCADASCTDVAVTQDRLITRTVTAPVSVTPADDYVATMPFGGTPSPPEMTYTIVSASDTPIDWIATVDPPEAADWLTVMPLSGTVVDTEAVDVMIAPVGIENLPVGVSAATVIVSDACTGETFERDVSVTVSEPFAVSHASDGGVTSTGVKGGPFEPATHVFTVSSETDVPVVWSLEVVPEVPDWLAVDGFGGTLPAMQDATVSVDMTPTATQLDVGTHDVTLRFVEATTGFAIERTVTLDVVDFVTPADGQTISGPLAGPFEPLSVTYTLQNLPPFPQMDIQVVVTDEAGGPVDWLDAPSALIALSAPPFDTAEAELAVTAAADALPSGVYTAAVTFNRTNLGFCGDPDPVFCVSSTRTVRLEVGSEGFSLSMSNVPEIDEQVGGPVYFFRMGRFEVTNRQFVRFLNDIVANPAVPPIVTHVDGVVSLAGDGTVVFDAGVGGAVAFDAAASVYSVVGDLHERPVTGVSWYGAAKFCNWMTGVQGMGDAELVYVESDVAGGWGAGGFDPATPGTNRNGFRLPLDDGATTAAARNEWNKAATRMMTADGDDPSFDAVYGFGRDVLTGADANFLASGDPFDDAVSPIGFFDGVETLTSGGVTSDTANGYGLYDVCGNVAEWVHERVSAEPGVWTSATRGGHFGLAVGADLLRNDARDTLPANSVFGFVGFRVAQSLEPVPLLVVQASDQVRADGPIGGPYAFDNDDDRLTLGLDNDGAYTLDTLDISIDQAWVEIDGVAPQQVPPQTIVDLPLRLTDAADDLPASPVPPGDLELVPGRNAEPGGPNEQPAGPTYDFWVSAIEVTNDQFAVFLNDALAHPTTGRGRYMCHDGDTGNVYINNAEDGVSGGGVCDGLTTLLYDASIGRIQFDADASPAYFVASGFGTHPVVGVTWYGAVKYCNWLTLFAGLPEGVRAYTESTEPAGWHPVTVTTADWQAGGFSAAQRQDLIRTTVGYRLPMDDGADVASTYNEWYKAAAWDRATTSDAVYGFGRDKLTPSDANYFDSGDPFEPDEACPDCGTTPVRFYDGTNELADDETATSDTANGYRLFDVCGNVAEWTQDFFQPGDASLRAVRGGSWVDPPTAVSLTNAGREAVSPDAANDHTGFRVVRGTGHIATVTVTDRIADVTDTAHVILDVREPLDITPFAGITASGTYGDDFAAPAVPDTTYTVLNTSAAAMGWQASVDETWLTATDADGGPLSGTLDAGASVSLTVATVDGANALAPGEHAAVVTIENTTTGVTQTRDAVLSIDWPIDVTVGDPPLPDDVVFDGFFGGPFENPADATLTLGSVVGFDLTYDVSVDAGWVTLVPADPDGALTGDLPAGGSRDFTVSINAAANALSVGDHDATLAFAFCDPGNCLCEAGCEPDPCSAGGCNLTATLERTVTLSVLDPIVIEPTEPWVIDEPLDPGVPPTQATVYTVTNHHAGLQIGVDIALEAGVDWLDVSATSVTPLPGGASGSEEVTVSLNANALLLPHGEHDATITFTDTFTGHAQDRVVTLIITENLSIQPADVFVSSGQPGVAVAPAFRIYELTNNIGETPDTIIWSVDTDPGVAWVSFAVAGDGIEGGVPNVDRPLADGASVHVVVSIDAALTAGLPDGVYDVDVVFVDVTHGESITRPIRLTLVTPSFTVGEAIIPGTDVQVNGPTYAFVMGRFAVTNAEFAAFLNDAYHAIGDPSDPRGQYMYHDTDTGDVYINDAQAAASGAAAPFGSVTTLMYDASIGRISFDAMEPDPYVVAVGLEQHPVVGVSWFGALKFCNWLTLDQGLLPGERCYAESTGDDVDGWHPISITTSNWATRDLTDAERQALVDGCRGYRLPMDDGADNNTPTIDSADAYNEWYKAASAHIMNQDGEDHVVFGAVYGFGRDAIVVQGPDAGRDANYECSGDPFEPVGACTDGGTTPVGYYDGTDHGGAYATNGNDNAFGLFDMSGNVYEWMQGRFVGSSANFRAIRGGSWHTGTPDAPLGQSSLRTRARNVAPVSGSVIVSDQVGFRIVRALSGSADFDGDGDVDAVDFMQLGTCMSGPVGPPLPACTAVDLNADGQVDLRDIAVFQGAFTGEP